MLSPDIIVTTVPDATPELLRGHGVKAVMVDMDDTLIASDGDEVGEEARRWLESLRQAGFPVLLLSNGERGRVERCCAELGIDGLYLAGKPFFWAFRRGLSRLGHRAAETAMVGDQLFTDVLGANMAGMVSVLVSPLTAGKLPHTRAARKLERLILRGGGHGRPVDR